jgi:hypothetical protein
VGPGGLALEPIAPWASWSLGLRLAGLGRGERVEMEAHLEVAGGPAGHGNVFCISVSNPAGEYAWTLSRNVVARGSARNSFRMPFNAPQGRWRVAVKDVASGVRAEGSIEVE